MEKERVYRPEEILQIEMASRIVLNDALGRYIHDPSKLGLIQDVLRNGLIDMQEIKPTYMIAMGPKPKEDPCPNGYTHENCACVVNMGTGPTGTTSG